MDLQVEIENKLGRVNAVQVQGDVATTTFVWNQEYGAYKNLNALPNASPWMRHWDMVSFLKKLPHKSRVSGTFLVVTLLDPTMRIE